MPIPEQPIVVSTRPLAFARRDLNAVSVRVLTLELMRATKSTPRTDKMVARRTVPTWPPSAPS
ncbi:MAG: hypothetical protein K0Q93_1134 [Nocardioidaceae bacterium]|nr:hypothetical protein [Nocardioidaceae bacterium]